MHAETLAPNHLSRCISEYERAIDYSDTGYSSKVPFYLGTSETKGCNDCIYISDNNRFLPFIQTLERRAKEKALRGVIDPECYGKPQFGLSAKTKKGKAHEIVGLIAMCYPHLSFTKQVFARGEPEKVARRVEAQYQEGYSVGISTSFGSAAEMKSSPYWFGRRGGIVDKETFQRFLHGENEENRYWDISDKEREKYPWLVKGYLKTIKEPECRIVESIVTSHPEGYAQNSQNNFVARLYPYKCGVRIEMMGGTANLRDLDSHTKRDDLICFSYDQAPQSPKIEIGSSYLLGPNIKQPFLRDVFRTYEAYARSELSQLELFKTILRQLALMPEVNASTSVMLMKYFFRGLKQGLYLGKQNKRIPQVEDLIAPAIKMVKEAGKSDFSTEDILRYVYEQIVHEKILEFKDVMLRRVFPNGSSFLLRDFLEFAQVANSSCLEFIGEVNNKRKMFRLYELRYQSY